jgi:hypothetical protein
MRSAETLVLAKSTSEVGRADPGSETRVDDMHNTGGGVGGGGRGGGWGLEHIKPATGRERTGRRAAGRMMNF